MIVHLFNSSVVSGPEMLVLPSLGGLGRAVAVVFLNELRCGEHACAAERYARELGLAVYGIPVRSRYDRAAIANLTQLLRELGVELLHAHDVKASSYGLWAARRLEHPPKLVSTHHGVRGRKGFKAKVFEQYYSRAILPHYDAALAVCSSDRDVLLRRGLRPEQVYLHLNGIDRTPVAMDERDAEAARIKRQWGLPGRGVADAVVVLGYAGRLSREKRLDRILYVLHALKAMPAPPWILAVFGRGREEHKLRALTRDLGLDERVHWMGYHPDLGASMAGVDVLVSLSDAEGLPINLLEAGWAGTPALCTGVDGIMDLYPHGEGAVLVAPGDSDQRIAEALAALLADPVRRADLGRKAQERVSRCFSAGAWRVRLLEVYEKVLTRAPVSQA